MSETWVHELFGQGIAQLTGHVRLLSCNSETTVDYGYDRHPLLMSLSGQRDRYWFVAMGGFFPIGIVASREHAECFLFTLAHCASKVLTQKDLWTCFGLNMQQRYREAFDTDEVYLMARWLFLCGTRFELQPNQIERVFQLAGWPREAVPHTHDGEMRRAISLDEGPSEERGIRGETMNFVMSPEQERAISRMIHGDGTTSPGRWEVVQETSPLQETAEAAMPMQGPAEDRMDRRADSVFSATRAASLGADGPVGSVGGRGVEGTVGYGAGASAANINHMLQLQREADEARDNALAAYAETHQGNSLRVMNTGVQSSPGVLSVVDRSQEIQRQLADLTTVVGSLVSAMGVRLPNPPTQPGYSSGPVATENIYARRGGMAGGAAPGAARRMGESQFGRARPDDPQSAMPSPDGPHD